MPDDPPEGDAASLDQTLSPGGAPASGHRPPPVKVLKGRWRVGREIGAGGMGVVYEAEHINLRTRAAVKLLHPERLSSPDAIPRLLREARLAGIAEHPGVTHVIDFDVTSDGKPYIIMELLEGSTLDEELKRPAPTDLPRTVDVLVDVLATLEAIHASGVVHRDIKPGNIFVLAGDGKPRTKLLDFGVARASAADMDARVVPGLTRTGEVLGTPHYMSPETARGRATAGPEADLWGVAVTFYRAVTGDLPFAGANYNDVIFNIWSVEPQPLPAGLPPSVGRFLGRALAKDRAARFPDARAMGAALARVREDLLRPPRAGRRRLLVAALAAAVLGGGGALLAWRLAASSGSALRLTWTPYRDAVYMRAQTARLREALGGALGREVAHVDAASYDDAVDQLVRGAVDVAGLSPVSYLAARRRDAGVVLLARSLSEGVGEYQSLIFVRATSPIHSLDEVRGKVFCFVAHGSTAGYAYPRALLRRAGIDPDRDVTPRMSGDHQKAIRMLDEGTCDAAGASSSAITEWAVPAGISPARFRILATSPPIPQEALVARSGLAPEELARLRAAVSRIIDDTRTGRLPAVGDMSGLAPASERDYEAIPVEDR